MTQTLHETLNLQDVVLLLEAALQAARELHDSPAVDDRNVRENRQAAAEQSRRLQVLTHLCEPAATESSAIFWIIKGFPDPLQA